MTFQSRGLADGLSRRVLGMRPQRYARSALRDRLAGRVVIVTGASRGVGAAVACRCAAAGAHVVLVARGEQGLDAVAEQIAARGGSASTVALDLRDTEAARAAAIGLLAEHAVPAVLVSNAGHSIHRDLAAYADRFHDVTRLTGVNMVGPIAFALPILTAMTAAGSGHLLSVGSVGMVVPGPGWSVYNATKAGFDAWLRSVSPELRSAGVATTSVHLPLTRTAMSAPTYSRSPLPSLSADEAATWVCRGLIRQPRVIAPWWSRAGGTFAAAMPGTADVIARWWWRPQR